MHVRETAAEEYAAALAEHMRYAQYYAAATCGIVALFTILYWTGRFYNCIRIKLPPPSGMMASTARHTRRILNGFVFKGQVILPGRVIVVMVYWFILIVLIFTNIYWAGGQTYLGQRIGWMLLCNVCLNVFLGLKNTPLSPLTGRSYESLNVLHRTAGYTTVIMMMIHSTVMISGFAKLHELYVFYKPAQHAAMAVGLSVLFIGLTSFMRKRFYEVWYTIHVCLILAVLIGLIFHTHQVNWSAMSVPIIALSMWWADRILRGCRWGFYGWENYCRLIPLPEGATKVIMRRSIRANAGSHAFLWIPSVRPLERHPFSLVSNDPAQFVISAQNGFTKALNEFAVQQPGTTVRASIEGPYGNIPTTANFEKIVLISGGSGVTFNIFMAMEWLKKNEALSHIHALDFIWVVRNSKYLTWFIEELYRLQTSPNVNVSIHITAKAKESPTQQNPHSYLPLAASNHEEEEAVSDNEASKLRSIENSVVAGRPDIEDVIRRATENISKTDRVLVAASGPAPLLRNVRIAGGSFISTKFPSVHLHLEEFDW